jgi:SPP1 family predicted phage head-tail adaptor
MPYRPLDAGSLDKRVTVQSRTDADDPEGGGGLDTTWANTGTNWRVSISTTGGREFQRAQQMQPELTHEIRGRFRSNVTAKHRLAYGSRVFTIHAVIDPMERHEQLVCYCSEITPV